jgi:hypothetical protein
MKQVPVVVPYEISKVNFRVEMFELKAFEGRHIRISDIFTSLPLYASVSELFMV